MAARRAARLQETVRVDAAREVGAELALDVAGQSPTVCRASFRQKGLKVALDEPVERSRLRAALLVLQRDGPSRCPHARLLATCVPGGKSDLC